jgi:hypothetical protein
LPLFTRLRVLRGLPVTTIAVPWLAVIEPLFVSVVLDPRGPLIKKASCPKLVTVPELVTVAWLLETVKAATLDPVDSVAPLATVPVAPVRFWGVAQTPGEAITPSPAVQSACASQAASPEKWQTVTVRMQIRWTTRSLDGGMA